MTPDTSRALEWSANAQRLARKHGDTRALEILTEWKALTAELGEADPGPGDIVAQVIRGDAEPDDAEGDVPEEVVEQLRHHVDLTDELQARVDDLGRKEYLAKRAVSDKSAKKRQAQRKARRRQRGR